MCIIHDMRFLILTCARSRNFIRLSTCLIYSTTTSKEGHAIERQPEESTNRQLQRSQNFAADWRCTDLATDTSLSYSASAQISCSRPELRVTCQYYTGSWTPAHTGSPDMFNTGTHHRHSLLQIVIDPSVSTNVGGRTGGIIERFE